MKKIISIIVFGVLICFLGGCKNSATSSVEEYLNNYKNLDEKVLIDMNAIIEKEDISEDNKNLYKDIYKKQYSDLKYKIENEEYNGDEAVIKVRINVYDLYKVQKEASNYLATHADEFNDENGNYDLNKFIEYKLNNMKNTSDRVDYTIDFYVVKSSNGWTVSSLSNSDLEKIHGIYNYES